MEKVLTHKFQTRKAAIEFAKKVDSKAERTQEDFFKYKVVYVVDTKEEK